MPDLTATEAVQASVWLCEQASHYVAEHVHKGGDLARFHGLRLAISKGLSSAWIEMNPDERSRFVALAVERYGPTLVQERELRDAVRSGT